MKITIEVVINDYISSVWSAYTNPDDIKQWNFASEEWCCPFVENNLKVGGTYKARMEAKDKSTGFDFVAVYKEIVPNKSITYELDDSRLVQITFDELEDATKVTITFDGEQEHSEEAQKQGWQSILDNFKSYVEGE